jgi:hypothetical protein
MQSKRILTNHGAQLVCKLIVMFDMKLQILRVVIARFSSIDSQRTLRHAPKAPRRYHVGRVSNLSHSN